MLAGSKRLCKDDLVDELMVIDAIANNPRTRATKMFFRTIFTKGILRQVQMYLDPITSKIKEIKK